jgi:hypothetical protein
MHDHNQEKAAFERWLFVCVVFAITFSERRYLKLIENLSVMEVGVGEDPVDAASYI